MAELVGALDVDVVAVARAGRLGGATIFTLQLVDRSGTTKARGSAQVSARDDLGGQVGEVVDDVGHQLTGDEPVDAPAPRSSSSQSSAPLAAYLAGLKTPLLIGGGSAAGVGVILVVAGVTPALLYSGAESELRVLRLRYVDGGGDQAVLDAAVQKQADAEGWRRAWNSVGVYAVWSGLLLATAGGGALAAGLLSEDGEP
jgi:hypothetical protein